MPNPMQMMMGMMGGQSGNPMMQIMQMMQSGGNPQAILGLLQKQNPQVWQQIQPMIQGKDGNQLKTMIGNMAQQRGTSLDQIAQMAKMMGINLPV